MTSLTSIEPSTLHLCAEWSVDPRPIYTAVDAAIGTQQKPNGLIPPHVDLVVSYLKVGSVFGESEWKAHCGEVGPAPNLPHNIEYILQSPCPAFPRKKLHETHTLVYIPSTLNAKPLTLNSLGEIEKRYFPTTKTNDDKISNFIVAELGDRSIEKSYWVLMTIDILRDSRNKNYVDQQTLVAELATKALAAYEVPRTLEAAVCHLTRYLSSLTSSTCFPFCDYTRSQESIKGQQPMVRYSPEKGLTLHFYHTSRVHYHTGVAPLRRF